MEVRRIPNWDGTTLDTELYHHGIKGQRWGVRRYQNPDGTLTAAGRKKYYADQNGYQLTKEGEKVASEYSKSAYETSRKISKNAIDSDKEFFENYKAIKKKDREIAEQEHQKWLNQTDYKGLDYYQFKDERAVRYENSTAGKQHREADKKLKTIVEKEVRNYLKTSYDRPLSELERRGASFSKTLGEDILSRTLNDYEYVRTR